MEEGNWKQGPFLSLLVKRPSLQVFNINFCSPDPLPVQFLCFLLSQVGHSPLCPPPFPTPPGKSHEPQGRGLHSSWQSRSKLSFPLHVARYRLGPCVTWIANTPLGAVTVRIWKTRRIHQKGEGWIPSVPSTTGHLKYIFLSQSAKGSLQLNTEREKRHSQANTHQSQ